MITYTKLRNSLIQNQNGKHLVYKVEMQQSGQGQRIELLSGFTYWVPIWAIFSHQWYGISAKSFIEEFTQE